MDIRKHRVWIDCDPGTDDAAALLTAHALPELEIVGISTVSGNVEPEKTFLNALRLTRLMGASYPVYAGAERPLIVEAEHSSRFHGENGLGDVELPLPERWEKPALPAWDALYEAALREGGELELIATGPLTNVALALSLHPALKTLLKRIVLMGGAAAGGNRTPCAEFNVWADPHAAAIVLESGLDLSMCGLDVTMKALLTPAELEELAAPGNAAGRFLSSALRIPMAAYGGDGVRLHDVTAVLFAARPELFSGRRAWVRVETESELTRGKTVTDLWSDQKYPEKNAFVVLELDRPAFVRSFQALLASIN